MFCCYERPADRLSCKQVRGRESGGLTIGNLDVLWPTYGIPMGVWVSRGMVKLITSKWNCTCKYYLEMPLVMKNSDGHGTAVNEL